MGEAFYFRRCAIVASQSNPLWRLVSRLTFGFRVRLETSFSQLKRLFRDPISLFILILACSFVFVAIIMPLYATVREGLSAEGRVVFERYISSSVHRGILQNTIEMGLVVATTGTLVGFLFAFVQVKLDVPLKWFMHLMALIPVVSPPFAVATATIVLFGRNGMITYGIFGVRYNIYGLNGLTLVLTLSFFTVAYLNLKGMLQALDPALDEAATNLGASKWRIFRTVTLPMLIPGIASSFLLLFVESISDLGNPLVLGGNYEVLAARIYITMTGLYDTTGAAVLSMMLLMPALTVFLVQRYWVNRLSVISVTGKPSGVPQKITHPLVKWPLFALAMFISLLIALIYGTIIVGAFVEVLGVTGKNNFTTDHFRFILQGLGPKAIQDTVQMAIIATPLAGIIGMIIAFLVMRRQFPGRAVLDFSAMLGIAVPGTIIGIGYLLVFNTPNTLTLPLLGEVEIIPKLTGGRGLYGGAVAIVLVYVTRSIPASLRAGVGALSQIDPSIEEASTSLGANSIRTFYRITLPLVRPAFLTGLIYAFARSMTAISAIIFLTTPRRRVMTAQILNEVEHGRYGNAFAYCVILIGVVSIAMVILYILVGGRSGAERSTFGGA